MILIQAKWRQIVNQRRLQIQLRENPTVQERKKVRDKDKKIAPEIMVKKIKKKTQIKVKILDYTKSKKLLKKELSMDKLNIGLNGRVNIFYILIFLFLFLKIITILGYASKSNTWEPIENLQEA